VILVAVGTYIHGFDELVVAADEAVAALGLAGFAQIGHSRVLPAYLAWERFLSPGVLAGRIAQASLVVCHGGIGLLGEAMRAGKALVVMPRRGRPTRASPAGDQSALVRRLAERHPIAVCAEPAQLRRLIEHQLELGPKPLTYDLDSDVPRLVARFLAIRAC
jgi:UDP-N-acetylglucosamine transferase subunit ALG13